MEVLDSRNALRKWRDNKRFQAPHDRIGLVPTMGALHEGHASLVRKAASQNQEVVATIFVNPTQFGPNEDLARYPRTLAADLELCSRSGATAVFTPRPEDMYPLGFDTWVDVGKVGSHWCGASRPGHFRGVSTVVAKLFLLVQPDRAYFGQKDAQQASLLAKMTRDLDFPLEFHVEPTVREPDGLALSSRNRYLGPEERAQAICLYQALKQAENLARAGERDGETLIRAMKETIGRLGPSASVDYLGFADPADFQPLQTISFPCHVLGAIRLGNTRLIDNIFLNAP